MDIQTLWQFLVWLAGFSIPTGIVLYVVRRLTKSVGDRITNAVDAYAGERAKLLAQFHNLDRLVEQTEKLTATTETIKAQVSDEMWDRQVRWTYKRDVYVKIIEAVGRIRTGLARLDAAFGVESQDADFAKQLAEAGSKQAEEANDDLVRSYDIAPIVVSPEAYKVLKDIMRVSKTRFNKAEGVKQAIFGINEKLTLFQQEAMKDLGYSATPLAR